MKSSTVIIDETQTFYMVLSKVDEYCKQHDIILDFNVEDGCKALVNHHLNLFSEEFKQINKETVLGLFDENYNLKQYEEIEPKFNSITTEEIKAAYEIARLSKIKEVLNFIKLTYAVGYCKEVPC